MGWIKEKEPEGSFTPSGDGARPKESLEISSLSDGAFDVTVAPPD